MISASDLKRRVTLQQPSNPQDTTGQALRKWTNVATVWAKVESMKGRTILRADSSLAELTDRVTIRFRKDVQSDWRVLYKDRALGLISIINTQEQNVELVLMCRELPIGGSV